MRVQTRAGRPPSEHCSYPCPWLPQVRGDRRTHVYTHAHAHAHAANSISPPSALLNPISNSAKRGRAPRGLGLHPPTHHWGSPRGGEAWAEFEATLSLPQPPSLWAFTSSACDPCGGRGRGRRQVRNSLRGPSCICPSWEETAGTVGHPLFLNRFLRRGRPRTCPIKC